MKKRIILLLFIFGMEGNPAKLNGEKVYFNFAIKKS
jgi:hypothetical protein